MRGPWKSFENQRTSFWTFTVCWIIGWNGKRDWVAFGIGTTFSWGYVMLEGTWDLDFPKCWVCSLQSYPKLQTAFTCMLPVLLSYYNSASHSAWHFPSNLSLVLCSSWTQGFFICYLLLNIIYLLLECLLRTLNLGRYVAVIYEQIVWLCEFVVAGLLLCWVILV